MPSLLVKRCSLFNAPNSTQVAAEGDDPPRLAARLLARKSPVKPSVEVFVPYGIDRSMISSPDCVPSPVPYNDAGRGTVSNLLRLLSI